MYLGSLKTLNNKLNSIASIFDCINSYFLIRRFNALISNLNNPITSTELTRMPSWAIGYDIFDKNAWSRSTIHFTTNDREAKTSTSLSFNFNRPGRSPSFEWRSPMVIGTRGGGGCLRKNKIKILSTYVIRIIHGGIIHAVLVVSKCKSIMVPWSNGSFKRKGFFCLHSYTIHIIKSWNMVQKMAKRLKKRFWKIQFWLCDKMKQIMRHLYTDI